MVFAGSAALALGAVSTVGGAMAVGVGAAGLGLSAASAAGAFGGSVDQRGPTAEEMSAARDAKKAYQLGRQIQTPLDAMARDDLKYLGSDQALANAGSAGMNQVWQGAGNLGQGLAQTAAMSGGPGSGRWWGQMGQATNGLDSALRGANLQGRVGGLNQYMARQGQFLGRRTNDLQAGLGGMTSGGQQAAQNQNARIQAQIQNNIAANQAMGQIGGMMTSVGMAGMGSFGGAAGGAAGGAPGYISPGGVGQGFIY